MDVLLGDAETRRALRALRPVEDFEGALARVAWNVVTEPGDGVAGALIAQLGAEQALRFAFEPAARASAASGSRLEPAPPVTERAERALAEARARWRPRSDPRAVRDALRGAADVAARLLLPDDPEWPRGIDDLGAHAPTALWVRGDVALLGAARSISVVGARAATAYGETVAAELAGDLAGDGTVVVSGGAYGIDGAAHRAALGVGGSTVAFLAGGVDRAYPAGHQQLFGRIRDSGAVVSELPCGAAPTKWRFLSRNRLIAALGSATVVVEAGWRSGSLNTAGHAAALGRPLGAVPGPITSAASAGCHRLMREYDARCVTSAAEVRELMGESTAPMEQEDRENPERLRMLDALSSRAARDVGELARRAGFSVEQASAILGLMSSEGIVVRDSSGWRRTG